MVTSPKKWRKSIHVDLKMGRDKRIWYLSPMRAAKVQASLRIRAVSPEPPLLAHTSNESRGTFKQKARSLAPLNGWACAVKMCHDGMLEDTNSLDGAQIICSCLSIIFTTKYVRHCWFNQLSGGVFFFLLLLLLLLLLLKSVQVMQHSKRFPVLQSTCNTMGISGKLTYVWHRSVVSNSTTLYSTRVLCACVNFEHTRRVHRVCESTTCHTSPGGQNLGVLVR